MGRAITLRQFILSPRFDPIVRPRDRVELERRLEMSVTDGEGSESEAEMSQEKAKEALWPFPKIGVLGE